MHSDQKTKAEAFHQFFIGLMGTAPATMPQVHWSNLYQQRTNLQHLGTAISIEEIKQVIKEWPNNKSPGPDGFTGEFYKMFCDILTPDIYAVFSTVMTDLTTLHPLNSSYIVLIPKIEQPTMPQHYRPISLIHAIQRIFSKVMANRIKESIADLVQPAQTGFVRDRQITEGFLYAQQVLHNAEQQNIPMAIFKADIHKAFDTVGWEFIIEIMRQLGFPTNWIVWIQKAVLQGTSQVIINGLLGKKITLRRGVRQGDPISPILFIIAIDFLNRWFSKLVQSGAWSLPYHDMKPCLLYADDALIFLKPEIKSIQIIKIAFTVFQQISGLAINLHKSELIVIKDQDQLGERLGAHLGCKLGKLPMTYLGLPLSSKKLNKNAYLPLIQRFNNRLAGWAAKHLTIAGRVVLINQILSSLPVYYMSCFKIPIWVIQEIDKIRRNFLWHGVNDHKKMNLVDWEVVCTPKKLGGLGVLDLRTFNNALLLKWCWKWVRPEANLIKPLLQHMELTQDLMPKPIARLTTEMRQFWAISISRTVGNGTTISFWHHNWGCGIISTIYAELFSYAEDETETLAQVLNAAQLALRQPISTTAEEQQTELMIHMAQTTIEAGQDGTRWKWTDTGTFTVKSAYGAIKNEPHISNNLHRIWKTKAPPRFKVFGWIMIRNKILTIDNLQRKGMILVNRCIMCKKANETVKHLFYRCEISLQIYTEMLTEYQIKTPVLQQGEHPIINIKFTRRERSLFLIASFVIWRERCARIFRDAENGVTELLDQIRDQWKYSSGAI